MKPFLTKLRTSLRTTPVIAVLVAAVFVAGLFAIEHWDMLPMKGQATPMYGEMHSAAKTKPKSKMKPAAKGSGSSVKDRKSVRAAKRTQSAASTASSN